MQSSAGPPYAVPHYPMYAPTPQQKIGPWQHPSAAQDPRSVPTPPISSQPRKKSRVSGTPEPPSPYYRRTSEGHGSNSQDVSPTDSRGYYDNGGYAESEYPLGAAPHEDFLYQADSSNANYFVRSKPYGRRSASPPPGYISGERSSRQKSVSQDVAHRSHSTYSETEDDSADRWGPNDSIPFASGGPNAEAAQAIMTELFPELNDFSSTDEQPRGGRSNYFHGHQSYSRRVSQVTGEPHLHGSTSPYRSAGSTRSSTASIANDRPRRDYPPMEYYYGLPAKSPPAHSAYTYESSNGTYDNYDPGNDYDTDYDDETDEDDDNLSAILVHGDEYPYYVESSASPDRRSPEPGYPLNSKYSSPEITTSSSSSNYPRPQMRSSRKSTTSSGPRRPRKANPHIDPSTLPPGPDDLKYDQNDRMLVYLRRQGVSYKTIKSKLGLDEAESTLRGRYRTLTKPKNERLRKPTWSPNDVSLLLEIVDPEQPHIKWKQVADLIFQRGGTYKFGSGTCKKKYLALVEEGRATPLNEGAATSKRRKHRTTGVHAQQ